MSSRLAGLTPRSASLILPFAAVLLLVAGCSGGGDESEGAGGSGPAEAAVEGAAEEQPVVEPTATPVPRRLVEIYFSSAAEDGLVGEQHEIFNTVTPGDRAKQIVADLISGPDGAGALRALPPGTRLRQAYVMNNGTAYLDFSTDLRDDLGGGSMQEILAVYAIVNSVAVNVNEIDRVGILINGRPVATLNGHVDLSRPLRPDYSLILGSIIVRIMSGEAIPSAAAFAGTGTGAG